jgi:tRNA dimethylallyltransferase
MIIFIVGPTGVGKSDVGFLLAQKLNGEIVSCDAMQVYREVNIACDKPSPDIRRQIPHHVLDVASVSEEFDVARYRELAVGAIEDILQRKKTPIVVGGSGMYMSILLDGIFESNAKDDALRAQLRDQAAQHGPQILHQKLMELDPKAAAKIHPNDTKRLIRALEVSMTAGQPISELQKQRDGLWTQYPVKIYALDRPREELYRRVEARIDRMFEQGIVEEVKSLSQFPLSLTAATLIGVPEVQGYLKGEYGLEQSKYLIKLNTRHYVKRQLTWFRRDKRVQWVLGDSALIQILESFGN